MPKPVLLDTDVLIDFLRGHEQAIAFVSARSERIMVSSVTVAELYDYAASHGVGLADAIIAATATLEDAALGTLNIKHYPMLAGLEPAYRK